MQKGKDRVLSLLQDNDNDSADSPRKRSQLSSYMDDDEAMELAMRRSLFEQSIHDITQEFPHRITQKHTPTNSPDSKKFKSSESVAGLQESFSKMPTPGKDKVGKRSEDISVSTRPRQSPYQSDSGYYHHDRSGIKPYTSRQYQRSQASSSLGSANVSNGDQSKGIMGLTPSRQSPQSFSGYSHQDWSGMTPCTSPGYRRSQASSSLGSAKMISPGEAFIDSNQSRDTRYSTPSRQNPYQSYSGYSHQDWSDITPYTSPRYQRSQVSSSLGTTNANNGNQSMDIRGLTALGQSQYQSYSGYSQDWSSTTTYTSPNYQRNQASSSLSSANVRNSDQLKDNSDSTQESQTPYSTQNWSTMKQYTSPYYQRAQTPSSQGMYSVYNKPMSPHISMSTAYNPSQTLSSSQEPLSKGPASGTPGHYTSHYPAQNQGYPPVHAPNQSASQLPLIPSQPNGSSMDRSQIKFKPYE